MLETIGAISFIAGNSCLMFAGALYFMRHCILGLYGCRTGLDGFYFPGLDARLFGQLAEAVDSDQLRTVLRCINTLILVLAISGAVLFFIGCVLKRLS